MLSVYSQGSSLLGVAAVQPSPLCNMAAPACLYVCSNRVSDTV